MRWQVRWLAWEELHGVPRAAGDMCSWSLDFPTDFVVTCFSMVVAGSLGYTGCCGVIQYEVLEARPGHEL